LKWVFTDVESHIPRHSEEVLAKLKELKAWEKYNRENWKVEARWW
jgi:hypothetical protein